MSQSENNIIGPALPPRLNKIIGPTLPPDFRLKDKDDLEETKVEADETVPETSSNVYGPVLPTNLQKNITESSTSKSYGPSLPPNLKIDNSHFDADNSHADALSDDEDIYGPLPPGFISNSRAREALEERALEIKLSGIAPKEDEKPSREEWMVELPKVGSGSLGLGSKHFRKNDRPDFSDRSSWTDTPQDRANKLHNKVEEKVNLKEIAELQETMRRDEEQSRMAKEYKKKHKRGDTLMDLHQEKLKKKRKEDAGEPSVRRPFNRETDLKVNMFDEAQKKAIMKKAMHLDDRFSKGQTKFL